MRVGVLVVAYNAAATLAQTLDRLPPAFAANVDHVLVCDDASHDETYEVGLAYVARARLPLTVVKHPENLGYGGNQKAGYHWALAHGLDVVVLLHGDGQYAPEVIESIVAPLVRGEADAVFGSRMLERGKARAGGMPLYKYVGNRILSSFQNRVVGMELSEWHSGYRAYRVDALADIDFDSYTNDFDFDTEIILGLHAAGKKIVEVPIPTYYGDEICHVNGLRYAKDVAADVLRFKARQMGFGTGPSGLTGMGGTDTEVYQFKPSPHSSHGRLLAWTAKRRPGTTVLDVGCSDGQFGALVRRQGHRVVGVDLVKHEGVGERLDEFVEADISAGLPEGTDHYDLIIAADILEHVADPETLLKDLRDHLNPGGEILVSVPNFAHWYPRTKVALGRFDYDQRGPLDHTHLRFFTRRTFERLVNACALHIAERDVVGSPVDVLDRGGESFATRAARGAARVDRAATSAWPTMFGYQFLYRLEPI
jgi:SAM-dependent methyltransferase